MLRHAKYPGKKKGWKNGGGHRDLEGNQCKRKTSSKKGFNLGAWRGFEKGANNGKRTKAA